MQERSVNVVRYEVSAETMADNIPMQVLMKRLGFRAEPEDANSIRAVLDL